ncbi:uncharacterized protein LOC110682908 [Chenopodium quinoa]|uniref:uncharacterized protein LOC110682908 n=1 Tax=Chenopodium quinoa TaxID=63459 RepID=UPI000B77E33D|nr:uncharacterized protein LOC110682908 [Chenopodium quinoa]
MVQKNDGFVSCKYGYPKKFLQETTNHDDGYPMYRRKNTGEIVRIRGAALDNSWVIPYNRYLSALFDCHLNVDVCSTIHSISICRWVSPFEAAWRIFRFDLFEMHPPVQPLQVHLENMHTVQIRPYEQLYSVILNGWRSRTQLTKFFKANAASPKGTGYLYSEFIKHNRWGSSAKAWFERKTKKIVIGRLAFVAPAKGERFFLRLLLINVQSPKSFNDLRTVDGVLCARFQEASIKRRLFKEDDAVVSFLAEVAEVHMLVALRRLFAITLVFCQPNNPKTLWLRFFTYLSEDYRHRYPEIEEQVRQQHLESLGKFLADFRLKHLHEDLSPKLTRTKDNIDAL